MAANDIVVPRENAQGQFEELVLPDATASARGLLSSSDKTKLDGIAAGAEVNVNADWNASSGDAQILNKPASFTPSTHGSSHHTGGTDALAAHQINGQTIFNTGSAIYSTDQTLTTSRALQLTVGNTNAGGISLTLPTAAQGTLNGDTIVIIGGTLSGPITIRRINVLSPLIYETLATITATGQQYRFRSSGAFTGGWSLVPVDTHTHPAAQITGLGTAATQDSTAFAPATGISPTAITGTAVVDNDARLSDSRTPTAHAASHASTGSDPLAPSDIGLGATDDVEFVSVAAESLKDSSGAVIINTDARVIYDGSGTNASDIVFGFGGGVLETALPISFSNDNNQAAANAATTRDNLGLGDSATAAIGTGAGEVAEGNHTHTQLHDRSHAITSTSDHTAGNHKVFYSNGSGEIVELALGSSGTVLTSNGATSAPSFAAASGGISAVNSTLADILSVSGSDLVADDLGADKLYGWDDSESKAIGFTIGSGLSVSGDTLSATASGGSKTYAVFSAEHNQPPSTAFATLDTRNSIAVLDFDDATDESAVFVSIIPEGASLASGLKIRLHWMATTATSGNVVWDVSLERMTTDLDTDSFDTIASGTAAANGTSGILTVTEITLTTIDSVTAGDGFRLKVTRDANNASDTMTNDAELVAVEIRSAA